MRLNKQVTQRFVSQWGRVSQLSPSPAGEGHSGTGRWASERCCISYCFSPPPTDKSLERRLRNPQEHHRCTGEVTTQEAKKSLNVFIK